jgi:hypothetical protein
MHPLLLIKRPADFAFFVWLALITSVVQVDTRLVCELLGVLRATTPAIAIAVLALVAAASFGMTVFMLLPRFAFTRQAVAAAAIHFLAFAAVSHAGAALRVRLAPPADCAARLRWPLDVEADVAILIVVMLTSSILTGVLNLISPHRADYAEIRERVFAYRRRLEPPAQMSALRELLGKAHDAAEKACAAEGSARYQQALEMDVLEPLSILLAAANDTPDDHPEEYLKRIGHRDPGLAPPEAVAVVSRAQRQVASLWKLPAR